MKMDYAIRALGALAQDSRLRVFRLLVRHGASGIAAGDIARELDLPASTLSTHLSILTNAGLINATRHSRSIVYSLDVDSTRGLLGFLLEDCCQGSPEICEPVLKSVLTDCCPPASSGDRCKPNGARQ
jgi:ArsR family transcriptional regulator